MKYKIIYVPQKEAKIENRLKRNKLEKVFHDKI